MSTLKRADAEADERFPPNWAQGQDLNAEYRIGFVEGVAWAAELLGNYEPESAEFLEDLLKGR
jgi:hypothetical protein